MKSLLGNGAEFAPFLAPWLVENVKTEDDFHMEGMSTGELAVVVLVTGLVIVFVALIALILIIKIYGSVVHGVQEAHRQKQQEKLAALSQPPAVPATQTNTKPAPAVEAGIPGEVVAAISAAVYSVMGEGATVVSVRRIPHAQGRSAWGQAGVFANTRPF